MHFFPAPDAFLSSAVLDGETTVQSYAFARYLMATGPKFQALVAALGQGRPFAEAVEDSYRATARVLVEAWLRRRPAGRG